MAGKNIPIALGFALITITQLVIGTCLLVSTARHGGEVGSLNCKIFSHSER